MDRVFRLARGLGPIGGTNKRIVLLAMASYANDNGLGHAADSTFERITELDPDLLGAIFNSLEAEGWVKRTGDKFILAIAKLEANQRWLLKSSTYDRSLITSNLGASAPLNRFKKG